MHHYRNGGGVLQELSPKAGEKGYRTWEHVQHCLQDEYQKRISLASQDPASFIEMYHTEQLEGLDPKVPELFQKRLLRRENLQIDQGVANPKLFTKGELDQYVESLNSCANQPAEQVKAVVSGLMSLGGENEQLTYKILDEILSSEKLSPNIRVYAENMLRGNSVSTDLAGMFSIEKQLFSDVSNKEKAELDTVINNSSIFKDWKNSLLRVKPELFGDEVLKTQESIKNLARYYQKAYGDDMKKSVNRAAKNLLSDNHIEPLRDLILPKKILDKGALVELNENKMQANLLNIRSEISGQKIEYDVEATFGQGATKEANLVKECMEGGRFMLLPDKKTLTYMVMVNGHYRYVMSDQNKALQISLMDIHNNNAQLSIWDSMINKVLKPKQKLKK